MLVVRPAGPADLDSLVELAILSGPGFTSLPEDPDALADRLELSQASFEGRVPWQEAWYTLMLEDSDTGDIDIMPLALDGSGDGDGDHRTRGAREGAPAAPDRCGRGRSWRGIVQAR